MFNSSNIPSTIPTIVLYPHIYFAAPSLTSRITGDFAASQASKIDFVHSKLLILNAQIA